MKKKLTNISVWSRIAESNAKFLFFPITLFYWGIVFWRNVFYNFGFFITRKAPSRIISVGNITAGGTGKDVEAYAIAFNVNDNMSVSFATQDVEFDKVGSANVTETIDAINASYTMGAASVRATVSEASDDAGTAGSDDEHMEISLVLSF